MIVSHLQKTPMLVIPSLTQAQKDLKKRLATKKYKILDHAKHPNIKNKNQTEQSTIKDYHLNQGIYYNSYLLTNLVSFLIFLLEILLKITI